MACDVRLYIVKADSGEDSTRMEEKDRLMYSVLMSVYYKENAEYLQQAMDSIWNQSVVTDDFVLVCDGPLTQELNAVIAEMQQNTVMY